MLFSNPWPFCDAKDIQVLVYIHSIPEAGCSRLWEASATEISHQVFFCDHICGYIGIPFRHIPTHQVYEQLQCPTECHLPRQAVSKAILMCQAKLNLTWFAFDLWAYGGTKGVAWAPFRGFSCRKEMLERLPGGPRAGDRTPDVEKGDAVEFAPQSECTAGDAGTV